MCCVCVVCVRVCVCVYVLSTQSQDPSGNTQERHDLNYWYQIEPVRLYLTIVHINDTPLFGLLTFV